MSFLWLQVVAPTVISTFCGTGGSSLGYKWAGFKELLAVDFESHAVECFRMNFPEVPVWHKSVTDITGQQIMDFCGIKPGELDVFDGSPPCQGFSTAGKRIVSDSRNDLFQHYVRLTHELQPKVFVMENVTGMAKGKMRGKFIEIMQTLKGLNYRVKCKQMNSKYYNVPQSRERLIFIGVRKDLERGPVYPIASKKLIPIRDIIPDIDGHHRGQFDKKIKRVGSVAYTLTKTPSMKFIRKGEECTPTKVELLRLCSFPEEWKMKGTGSGTTALACKKNGFRHIGIEQTEEHYDIATKRIEHDQTNRV